STLTIEQLNEKLILDFLTYLQRERNNTARTINSRLAAIKSFMRFLQYRVPTALEQINRILAIPVQRTDRNLIRHLKQEEAQALLNAPDPTTRTGIRDRAMVHLALSGGLRVSELVGLRISDLHFDNSNVNVLIHGKGRKQRELRLWRSVTQSVRAWLSVRGQASVPELFLNARGQQMTRAGFEYILERCRVKAAKQCPSLIEKKLSPHILRHTCALTILKATGDLRQVALWLGHESTITTECYLQLDPLEKLQSISGFIPTSLRPGKFQPSDRLIAMLRGKKDYVE
ncbi:TPA: tyrosine-type recombinase/integrase, partial [Escherichia coli]